MRKNGRLQKKREISPKPISLLIFQPYFTSNNSTSKMRVALGGITEPEPDAP